MFWSVLFVPSYINNRRFISCTREPSMSSPCAFSAVLLMASLLGAVSTAGGAGDGVNRPGCASCGLPPMEKDAEETLMIEVAKQQILDKLHLKERPNITQTVPRVALLSALRKLHAGRVRQDGSLELDNSSNNNDLPTKDQGYEIVSFADLDDPVGSDGQGLGLTFQFLQERSQSLQVLQSSLWIYARSSQDAQRDSRLRAQVFLSGPSSPGSNNRTLVTEKLLEVRASGWHTFPVTRTLQSFLDGGGPRLRLEVWCLEDGKNLCSLRGGPTAADTSHQPFLVAQVRQRSDPHHHALRRRSLSCGEDTTVCCKKDFYIKFKDIQWQDWIIYPEGYHMNYCMGQCPQHLAGSPGIASSFHATVFSQLKVNGINTAASSCCVPKERRPLSMVYFNSQYSIIKTDVQDMIVESCGCT